MFLIEMQNGQRKKKISCMVYTRRFELLVFALCLSCIWKNFVSVDILGERQRGRRGCLR